jgi:hypothetical protein
MGLLKTDFNKPSSEFVGTGAGFFMGQLGSFNYSDLEDVKEYISKVDCGAFPLAKLSLLPQKDEMRKTMIPIYSRVLLDRKKFKAHFASFVKKPFLMLSKDCGKKV